MDSRTTLAFAGQRPGDKPTQGNALGGRQNAPSPERAAQALPPFQGWGIPMGETQGVALGWLVCAPLVLPSLIG